MSIFDIHSNSSSVISDTKSFKSGFNFEKMKALRVHLQSFEDVLRECFGLSLRQTSTAGPRGQEHLKLSICVE